MIPGLPSTRPESAKQPVTAWPYNAAPTTRVHETDRRASASSILVALCAF
jgi:hypothetical protein